MDFDLEEMLTLRAQGWSTIALGIRYNKDHTTIVYHCKKNGVKSVERPRRLLDPEIIEPILPRIKVCDKYANLFDEPMNRGKTYKQYLEESRARQKQKAAY